MGVAAPGFGSSVWLEGLDLGIWSGPLSDIYSLRDLYHLPFSFNHHYLKIIKREEDSSSAPDIDFIVKCFSTLVAMAAPRMFCYCRFLDDDMLTRITEKLRTVTTDLLKINHPIMLAGMNVAAGPKLAAAVTNAGGIGIIGGVGYDGNELMVS